MPSKVLPIMASLQESTNKASQVRACSAHWRSLMSCTMARVSGSFLLRPFPGVCSRVTTLVSVGTIPKLLVRFNNNVGEA